MPIKSLSICIVNRQAADRIRLKRELYKLGCFRTTIASSIRELIDMTLYSSEPFERSYTLLLDAELVEANDIDMETFITCNPQIRHALIYGGRMASAQPLTLDTFANQHISWVHSITPCALYKFISHIAGKAH